MKQSHLRRHVKMEASGSSPAGTILFTKIALYSISYRIAKLSICWMFARRILLPVVRLRSLWRRLNRCLRIASTAPPEEAPLHYSTTMAYEVLSSASLLSAHSTTISDSKSSLRPFGRTPRPTKVWTDPFAKFPCERGKDRPHPRALTNRVSEAKEDRLDKSFR